MIQQYIQRALAPLMVRINSLIGKALLNAIDNSSDIQVVKVQALDGDVLGGVERVEEYGHTSIPPTEDSEVLYASLSGNRDDVIALKIGHSKARPKDLKTGDNCFWDIHGNRIWLKDGLIGLNGDDKSFVTYKELNLALQNMVTMLNSHTHITTATVGPSAIPGVIAPPTIPTTLDISASETTTIKTGG